MRRHHPSRRRNRPPPPTSITLGEAIAAEPWPVVAESTSVPLDAVAGVTAETGPAAEPVAEAMTRVTPRKSPSRPAVEPLPPTVAGKADAGAARTADLLRRFRPGQNIDAELAAYEASVAPAAAEPTVEPATALRRSRARGSRPPRSPLPMSVLRPAAAPHRPPPSRRSPGPAPASRRRARPRPLSPRSRPLQGSRRCRRRPLRQRRSPSPPHRTVVAAPEPEPVAAAPEPVVAAVEPEPDAGVAAVAPEPEPQPAPAPIAPPSDPSRSPRPRPRPSPRPRSRPSPGETTGSSSRPGRSSRRTPARPSADPTTDRCRRPSQARPVSRSPRPPIRSGRSGPIRSSRRRWPCSPTAPRARRATGCGRPRPRRSSPDRRLPAVGRSPALLELRAVPFGDRPVLPPLRNAPGLTRGRRSSDRPGRDRVPPTAATPRVRSGDRRLVCRDRPLANPGRAEQDDA